MNLTLNSYTQWYWKTDLLNLLNFLFLKLIVMHNMKLDLCRNNVKYSEKMVPITHAAFLDYRVGAVHVSSK